MITGDRISTEVKFQEISSMWGCTFSKTGSGVEVFLGRYPQPQSNVFKIKNTRAVFTRISRK